MLYRDLRDDLFAKRNEHAWYYRRTFNASRFEIPQNAARAKLNRNALSTLH